MPDHIDALADAPVPSQHGSDDHSNPRKRKRHAETANIDQGELPGPFTVRDTQILTDAHASDTIAFTPVAILDRACLPLAYLDQNNPTPTRFHGRIVCLEGSPTDRSSPHKPPAILIVSAGLGPAARLYVVERVSAQDYVLCRLLPWVTLQHLRPRRVPDVSYHTAPANEQQEKWWMSSVPNHTPSTRSDIIDPISSISLTLCRPATLTKSLDDASAINQPLPILESQENVPVIPNDAPATDPDTASQAFLAQYLDTLYISRTSLAYFAKASLPRLKNAFDSSQSTECNHLPDFLRGMILASKTSDTKYHIVLPQAAREAATAQASEPESFETAKKRKKVKMVKLDKSGLLPQELVHFGRWWKTDQGNLSMSDDLINQHFKTRSLELRTRETFLQVMLILEALAAEAIVQDSSTKSATNGIEDAVDAIIPTDADITKKNKKKQDLNLALEMMLDKLCIWHSLDQPTPRSGPPRKGNDQTQASNVLRDFCVEVVIPFFASRLPGPSKVINQKLGGPVATTPRRSKSSSTVLPKSHRATKQAGPERKARGPLQRMASESLRPLSGAAVPSLQRSATDTQLGARTRLPSETPSLTNFRPIKPPTTATIDKKPSALDRIRSRQREVDFDAMTQVQEAKKKRQAEIDAKLKDAINTLKKPHRTLVSAEVADAVAQRTLMAKGRAKASSSTAARSRGRANSTQVQATPSHSRVINMNMNMGVSGIGRVELTPDIAGRGGYGAGYADPGTHSSVSMIPSSAVRPGTAIGSAPNHIDQLPAETSRLDPYHTRVQESPSRTGRVVTRTSSHGSEVHEGSIEATPWKDADRFLRPALPKPKSLLTADAPGVARSLKWNQARLEPSRHPKTPTKRLSLANGYGAGHGISVSAREVGADVHETDTARGLAGGYEDCVHATPDAPQTAHMLQTPIVETPVKSRPEQQKTHGLGQRGDENTRVALDEEVNIYDALGWND